MTPDPVLAPWVDPDPAATRVALARLRAYLAATPPTGPADWEREGLPLSVYGGVPRLAPAPPPPEGVGWDAETRPGPQPENAGLTPGWPPEPPPPPELAAIDAAVEEVRAVARDLSVALVATRAAAAAAVRASDENRELADAVAAIEWALERGAAGGGTGNETEVAAGAGEGGPRGRAAAAAAGPHGRAAG